MTATGFRRLTAHYVSPNRLSKMIPAALAQSDGVANKRNARRDHCEEHPLPYEIFNVRVAHEIQNIPRGIYLCCVPILGQHFLDDGCKTPEVLREVLG